SRRPPPPASAGLSVLVAPARRSLCPHSGSGATEARPPRTVLPPLCLWGRGLCRAHRQIPPGIFGAVSVSIPGPSRRKPSAIRLTHGRWTRSQGAGHGNLRASVGSTDAAKDVVARFGRIDRSVGRSPCALRSDRPKWPFVSVHRLSPRLVPG